MTTPLLLLRHAATAWNDAARLQGLSDQPLSPRGRAELATWTLPAAFADAAILCSPLARARATAARFGSITVEPRLVEMDWGAWEGQHLSTLRAADPSGLAAMEAQGLDFRPPGGESPREVRARVAALLRDLDTGRPTVLVTHKGVMRAALSLATGWPFIGRPPLKVEAGVAWMFRLEDGSPTATVLRVAMTSEPAPCGS